MTITSLGYSGTIAPNVGWANMQQVLGSRYMVASHTDCVVSPLVGGTRQIQVSTGYMGGWGILDQITATETLTLATVASGIHYWLICAHRNWTTPVTTITAIDAGTALPATMPTRSTSPGTTDDQPLALVSIAAGATNPVVIYDLRAIGGPNIYNMSASLQNLPNWLSYMAIEGSTVYTGNKRWYRSVNQFTGNAFWDTDPEIVTSGPGVSNDVGVNSALTGWTTSSTYAQRFSRSGNACTLLLQANTTSSTRAIEFGPDGGVSGGDTAVLTVSQTAYQPPYSITDLDIRYIDGSRGGSSYHGGARLDSTGDLVIESGLPNTQAGPVAESSNFPTIRAIARWTREA
jgi:hypothetical protein